MNTGVLPKFEAFLLRCGEGRIPWLYLDDEGIMSAAIGCAIFRLAVALGLGWRNEAGLTATPQQIAAAWATVASRTDLVGRGAGAFERLTAIRLPDSAIDTLVAERVATFEGELREALPNYDRVPDAAQEGVCRLAWATGGERFAKRWPKFTAAFIAQDWRQCANQCEIEKLAGEPDANTYEKELFESLCPEATGADATPSEPAPPA